MLVVFYAEYGWWDNSYEKAVKAQSKNKLDRGLHAAGKGPVGSSSWRRQGTERGSLLRPERDGGGGDSGRTTVRTELSVIKKGIRKLSKNKSYGLY